MKKKTRKVNRGMRPPERVIAAMGEKGYALVSSIAKELKLPPTTIYDWVARDVLAAPAGDKRPVHLKYRGCVWVLVSAVKARVDLPAVIA